MKPILMILGLILAAGAGAVGGILAAPRATRVPTDAFVDARPTTAPAPTTNPELEKRLQALSLELSGLQSEIAGLRDDRSRAPAAAETIKSEGQLAVAGESPALFAAAHREAILMVLADERAAQEKKREDDRKERELKANEAKADRAAQKLGLSTGQRQTLVDYYTAERVHIEEMRAQFRDGGQEGGAARDAFREGREWRANELTRLFGTELGAHINEFESEGMRGRVAGAGGQRRGGGDGQNGGNAAGGTPVVPGGNR